jgi:dTDP-4-amino-4,6-dideoxygalactose transaminase
MIGRARVSFEKPLPCDRVEERIGGELRAVFGGDARTLLFPSGRSALYFGLRSLPVDRVVLPAFTCKAVLEATLFASKKPLFVDVDPSTCAMYPVLLARLPLGPRDAVLCTHQYGFPAPVDEIEGICRRTGAVLIEDCAASFGTIYKGGPTGLRGRFSVFSADAFKMLPVAAGMGFLVTRDGNLAAAVANDPLYGSASPSPVNEARAAVKRVALGIVGRPFWYGVFYTLRYRFAKVKNGERPALEGRVPRGYHERPTAGRKREFLAALASRKQRIEKRRRLARYYFHELRGLSHVRTLDSFCAVNDELGLIRFPVFIEGMDRMEFYRGCVRRGIDPGFVFPFPLPGSEAACPNAARLCESVLNLPFYEGLTEKEMRAVVDSVRSTDGGKR